MVEKNIRPGWASCPITQNGFVRIITQPRYPRPITVSETVERLQEATRTSHHVFWSDDISITENKRFRHDRIHSPQQLTDLYLVALASHHQCCFITFDQSIPISALPGITGKNLVVL